ncbi:MAG: MqnA/MqnD/SBP family protein, partial [Gemmatimonadales bacterium]
TLTTAYLSLRLCQPAVDPVVMPFDTIEAAVLGGEVDAGLLIHEGQLTYADRGLHRWLDLGEWWHGETGLPLPLGGNVVRRDLHGGPALIGAISEDLKQSILYGLSHRPAALAHAQRYARDLEPARTDRFVGMYVNAYTVDYGPLGRRAVEVLLARGFSSGLLPRRVTAEFVP